MSVIMGTGVSTAPDIAEAGREAATQMLTHLGTPPQLTLVFSGIRFAHPRLLSSIRDITAGAPLIGCTAAGSISTWGTMRQSVVVVGLRGFGAGFVTGVANSVSRDPEAAGRRLAQDLKASEPGVVRAALIFPDGLAVNGSALLRGVQRGLGAKIPIVGGSAGDDYYFQKTFQYFDDQILTNSVPGALLHGDLSVGVGVRHGWIPLGQARQVTRAEGGILRELDGKPAISIYESYLGTAVRKLIAQSPARITLMYPLGVTPEGRGECLLRSALCAGEKGALVCTGDVPEGSWVRLMIGARDSALSAAEEAAKQAVAGVGSSRFKGALIFSNGGRQKMLGSEAQGEVDVIRDSLGGVGVRLGGFYGYGEQAPLDAANTFHNQSVVVMALG